MSSDRIICLAGPTASGKTALGLRLAQVFQGEVINADARQLYRDAPIGTGVPPGQWEKLAGKPVYHVQGIPHHLMAISGPEEVWTVSRWQQAALQCIQEIQARQNLPIVVGGTGLYIRALCEGFVFAGEPDPELRTKLLTLTPAVRVERLQELDPTLAQEVDLRNPHRVLRALERAIQGAGAPRRRPPSFQVLKLAQEWPLEALKKRVEERIEGQWEAGWVKEVKKLLAQGVAVASPLMQSIGFRTIALALEGGRFDETEVLARVKQETWQYARRQLTWFRKEPQLHWVERSEEAEAQIAAWVGTPVRSTEVSSIL